MPAEPTHGVAADVADVATDTDVAPETRVVSHDSAAWILGHMTHPITRAEMSAAGVAAAVAVAREHGVRVEEPVVLHDLFSLRVHLRPAPVVARVPTWTTRLVPHHVDLVANEVGVVEHLVAQGVPVVRPSGELPPGPHVHGGFAVSFWTFAPLDTGPAPTVHDCAAMLPGLHAALSSYPGALPDLLRDVVALPDLLAAVDRARHRLSNDDLDVLRRTAEEINLPAGKTVALHGDAHPGNVLRSGGELLWNDFEQVALGPPEWDMATMHDAEVAIAQLDADPDRLAACLQLRDLQVALCLAGLDDVFGDVDGWAEGLQSCIDSVRTAPRP